VASKKKVEEKAETKQVGKDGKAGKAAASSKAKPKKAPKNKAPKKEAAKKNAAPKGADASKANDVPGQRRRIPAQDVVDSNETVETIVPELDPFEVAKKTVKGSVPAIVNAMVKLAKQGSCSHAKTLLEMTGARHMFDGDSEMQDSGEPWAKLVLERLGKADPTPSKKDVLV
jgi:hypothetical protein